MNDHSLCGEFENYTTSLCVAVNYPGYYELNNQIVMTLSFALL